MLQILMDWSLWNFNENCSIEVVSVRPDFFFRLLQISEVNNHLFHDIDVNMSNIPANLAWKSRAKSFSNNINLLDHAKIEDLIPLTTKESSVDNNSNALSDQKIVKT